MSLNWEKTTDWAPRRIDGDEMAAFIREATYERFPAEVTHQAKRMLLEGISWMAMGSRHPGAGLKMTSFLSKLPTDGKCVVIGAKERYPAAWAAFANAAFCQVHDCNDGYPFRGGSAIHPGRTIIPSALALADETRATGRELLTAIIVGYEVGARTRGPLPPPSDAYGAAAVASRLLKLDDARILSALGIAGHCASPRPKADASDIDYLTNGYIAKAAVEAGFLAMANFSGPSLNDDPYSSTRYFHRGMGKKYHIMDLYVKPYPTCRMTHGAVDAALDFREKVTSDCDSIVEIRVRIMSNSGYVSGIATPERSHKSCQMSLPYAMARALLDGELTDLDFTPERLGDKRAIALQKRIAVIPDRVIDSERMERGRLSVIEIKTTDGNVFRTEYTHEKGEYDNPLSDDELADKFRRWAGPSFVPNKIEKVIRSVFSLDRENDVGAFTELLRNALI